MSVDSWQRASLDKPDQLKPTMEETSILSWLTSNNGASLDRSQSTIIDKNRYVNHEVVHIAKPRLSFYFEDSLPRSFANEAPEEAHTSSFGAQSQNPEVSWPQLGASVDRMLGEHKQTLRLESLDIKDVVRESLHRRWPIVPKENSTKDCNTQGPFLLNQLSSGLGNSKKLSLVTSSGRDKSDLPCEQQRMAQLMDVQSDLPCLCSANTRTGLHLHINKGCQMQFLLDSMEKDLIMLANDENFSTLGRCFGGNEVSRLTVELDDGPLISASSSRRRKMSPNAPGSYKPLDNTHCLKEVRDPCPPGFDFKDVLQASWQVRDTSPDVCKDLPCAAPYPGLSDDTDVAVKNSSSGARGDHQETARCQETNVVARLMGLEKFPSFAALKIPSQKPVFSKTQSREAELIQDLLRHTPTGLSGSPQARLLDESSQMSDRGGSGSCQIQEQRNTHSGEAHELRLRSPSSQSPKFMERMPLVFKQQDTCNAMKTRLAQTGKRLSEENLTVVQKSDYSTRHEPLYGDMAQLVRQLWLRNSVQERKALKQILEAMKLKGLLHPPNHKLVQDLKSKTDPIMPKEHLQPQWCELNQQPIDSSKLTTTILNKGHTDLEHKETSRLGAQEYSMSLNTRTPEQMIQEPEKVSLTYTTPAHSENGGPTKTAERKPQRAQARSNNRSSKDGLNVSQQPCWLDLNSTTPTIKSIMSTGREPNILISRPQCQCRFGSRRMGEKRNLQGQNSPLKDHEECRVIKLTSELQKTKESLKAKASIDPNTMRSRKAALADAQLKPRIPNTSRKPQRNFGAFVGLASHKRKPFNPSDSPQHITKMQTSVHHTDKITAEHEKASKVQSGVQESRNAGTVRVIEGEALNHSEDLCLQNPDFLGFSGNMRSCDVRAELEVASAEVMKDNNVTANDREVSELQSSPNSLGEKFELNESLPMVGGMEHSSPLYVLSNTGVEDERPNLYDAVSEIASTKLPLFLNPDLSWTTTSLLPLFLKPDLQGTTTSFAQQPQQQQQEVSVQEPMMAQRWTEPTTAQRFAQEVWKELQQIPCGQFDDVHDTVQSALQKDMGEKLGQSYSEFRVEITEVGLEVERRIFKDLVQGVVAECFRTQEPQ